MREQRKDTRWPFSPATAAGLAACDASMQPPVKPGRRDSRYSAARSMPPATAAVDTMVVYSMQGAAVSFDTFSREGMSQPSRRYDALDSYFSLPPLARFSALLAVGHFMYGFAAGRLRRHTAGFQRHFIAFPHAAAATGLFLLAGLPPDARHTRARHLPQSDSSRRLRFVAGGIGGGRQLAGRAILLLLMMTRRMPMLLLSRSPPELPTPFRRRAAALPIIRRHENAILDLIAYCCRDRLSPHYLPGQNNATKI